MNKTEAALRVTYLGIFGNALLALIKWLTGYFGNSYALIADAIESTSDIFSSLLLLVGIRYASRPADQNHPYGHGRAEPLITFIVVGFLVVSGVIICIESVKNIRTPHELPAPYTLIVLGGVIIIKEVFYRIVKRRGIENNSTALQADAFHHRSDAITSLMAFIGISVALWLGKGYEAADDWAALFAAGIIFYNSYRIFRPALGEIMDEQLNEKLIAEIHHLSREVNGVVETEKCLIRKVGTQYLADLHVVVNAELTVREGHHIAHAVKDHLRKNLPQVANVLVHIEPHGA
jgi:cation diffusion facilitator family transporter